MSNIEIGDRFESKDSRDRGRIVEVTEARGLSGYGANLVAEETHHYRGVEVTDYGMPVADYLDLLRAGETFYTVRTEVHPNRPTAVGNVSRVSERTLRDRYRKVSH